jgi:hypothetical protein
MPLYSLPHARLYRERGVLQVIHPPYEISHETESFYKHLLQIVDDMAKRIEALEERMDGLISEPEKELGWW